MNANDRFQADVAELATGTGTTVDSWDLAGDTPVTVYRDGTVNALSGTEGVLIADLTAGNKTVTESVAQWFAEIEAGGERIEYVEAELSPNWIDDLLAEDSHSGE